MILYQKSASNFIVVRLSLPAQEAVAGQVISVALGQYGVKSQEFIKDFNAKTNQYIKGLEVTVYVKVFKDGSFEINLKGPKVAHILKICFDNIKEFSLFEIISEVVPVVLRLRPDLKILSSIALAKSIISSLKGKNV